MKEELILILSSICWLYLGFIFRETRNAYILLPPFIVSSLSLVPCLSHQSLLSNGNDNNSKNVKSKVLPVLNILVEPLSNIPMVIKVFDMFLS